MNIFKNNSASPVMAVLVLKIRLEFLNNSGFVRIETTGFSRSGAIINIHFIYFVFSSCSSITSNSKAEIFFQQPGSSY